MARQNEFLKDPEVCCAPAIPQKCCFSLPLSEIDFSGTLGFELNLGFSSSMIDLGYHYIRRDERLVTEAGNLVALYLTWGLREDGTRNRLRMKYFTE